MGIYMFVKYVHPLKTIINSVGGDGHAELHNITRMVHPISTEDTVEFNIPSKGNGTNFLVHVINLVTLVYRGNTRKSIVLLGTNSLTWH